MYNYYLRSHAYEHFIMLARLCSREQFGAHNKYMLNLMNTEDGNNYVQGQSHREQLELVQKNLVNAAKAAMKRRIDRTDKDYLQQLVELFGISNTSHELLKLCDIGIEVLRKYKTEF